MYHRFVYVLLPCEKNKIEQSRIWSQMAICLHSTCLFLVSFLCFVLLSLCSLRSIVWYVCVAVDSFKECQRKNDNKKTTTTRYKLTGNLSTLLAKRYFYIFIFIFSTFSQNICHTATFSLVLLVCVFYSLQFYILNFLLHFFSVFFFLLHKNTYSHCYIWTTPRAAVGDGCDGGGDVCILVKILLFRSIVNSSIVDLRCSSHCVRKSYDTLIIVRK